MLPSLQRVIRPALILRSGTMLGRAHSSSQAPLRQPVPMLPGQQCCNLGTHPHKDPMEPLNSPQGAKDFIYSLHPTERTILLRELHRFESIAIAQGPSWWSETLLHWTSHTR
uniref:Transmembrane protein 65 n=1 Tax=Esox lucius TaxID=8010 RepID=A0A3P8ZD97_ESOLU